MKIETQVVSSIISNLGIPDLDARFLARYFEMLKEHSDSSLKNAVVSITMLYECASFKSLESFTIDDINMFVDHLVSLNLKDSVKNHHFVLAKTWVKRAMRDFMAIRIQITNYFEYVENPFSAKNRNKRGDSLKVDLDMDAKENIKSLTDAELDAVMLASKLEEKWFQILLLILKYTGMRVSEAVTLRLENIDFKERVMATGVVKNHAKSGKVIFFVPEEIALEMRSYAFLLPDGEEWFFPAPNTPGTHMAVHTAEQRVLRLSKKTKIHVTAHMFRHTLIKKREQKECPDHVNEFLQNQAVTGTQAKYYRERNFTLRDRRDLYDRWNPF